MMTASRTTHATIVAVKKIPSIKSVCVFMGLDNETRHRLGILWNVRIHEEGGESIVPATYFATET